jgi:hypothetical protein
MQQFPLSDTVDTPSYSHTYIQLAVYNIIQDTIKLTLHERQVVLNTDN